jgi:hypothetical protein
VARFTASLLAENEAGLRFVRSLGEPSIIDSRNGVVELVMDLPDEGLPDTLVHAMRAAARGEVQINPQRSSAAPSALT